MKINGLNVCKEDSIQKVPGPVVEPDVAGWGVQSPPDTGKLRGAEIPYHNFFFFLYQIFFLDNYFFRIIWNECKRKNHKKWSKNIFAPILMKKMFHMFQRILRKYIIYILYFLTIFLRKFFFNFLESSETYGNNFH